MNYKFWIAILASTVFGILSWYYMFQDEYIKMFSYAAISYGLLFFTTNFILNE